MKTIIIVGLIVIALITVLALAFIKGANAPHDNFKYEPRKTNKK